MKNYHIAEVRLEYNRYRSTVIADSLAEAIDNYRLDTSEVVKSDTVTNTEAEGEVLTIVEGSEVYESNIQT